MMQNKNRDVRAAKSAESVAAWRIELITGRKVVMMPEFSLFDFVIYTDQDGERLATAFAEFRHRPSTKKSQYATLIMNKKKVDSLVHISHLAHVRPIIVAQWSDNGLWWVHGDGNFTVSRDFERNVRERQNDRPEDVYNIPTSLFKSF